MRKTVTSASAALIDGTSGANNSYILKNVTGSPLTIHLEIDATAGATDGFPWAAADGPIAIDLAPGQVLNAKSAGADQEIRLLRIGH